MAVLSMFMQYEYCFASYLSISGCCTQHPVVHSLLVVHSLPVKNRKALGYDIMYTSAACVSLSITPLKQTVLKTQNSSIHGCVLATFKHWFITNQSLNGLKNCYGICVLIYFIPFLLTGPVVFLKTYSFSWNFAFTAESSKYSPWKLVLLFLLSEICSKREFWWFQPLCHKVCMCVYIYISHDLVPKGAQMGSAFWLSIKSVSNTLSCCCFVCVHNWSVSKWKQHELQIWNSWRNIIFWKWKAPRNLTPENGHAHSEYFRCFHSRTWRIKTLPQSPICTEEISLYRVNIKLIITKFCFWS